MLYRIREGEMSRKVRAIPQRRQSSRLRGAVLKTKKGRLLGFGVLRCSFPNNPSWLRDRGR